MNVNNTTNSNHGRGGFSSSHRETSQYLQRPQISLPFHYSHIPSAPQIQYSHINLQTQTGQLVPPTHKPIAAYDFSSLPSDSPSPVMIKQLMSNNTRGDCESAGSDSLRYQHCEPGMEVNTCEPGAGAGAHALGAGAGGREESLSEWSMLDRLVTSHDHLGHHHEDSSTSKGVRFDQLDANASSVHHMNPLSLRGGEMDLFWGYGK